MMMPLPEFMNLFPEFRAPSWDGWRAILGRLTPTVRELFAIVGRGAGKSRIVALIACAFASRAYPRAPGEFIYLGVFGPDRKQAAITLRYILGLLRSVPALAALIVSEAKDSVELSTGVVIEVITASVAAPRGRSYALVIVEEAAFLPTDQSVNPDIELLRAVRPALARVPGSLLVVVSSPYARKGVLWTAWQKYHERQSPDVVFVQAPTLDLNPTFDASAIEKAYADDPASAAAEFGAVFRSDVESFVSLEAIDACVVPGRFQLPRVAGLAYDGALDFAGGTLGNDSAACGIGHRETRHDLDTRVLDAVLEIGPPFSPEAACSEFAALLHAYGVSQATSDRWAGQFPVEQMQKHGITVQPAAKPKSDLYRDLLPLINSRQVELLDHPRLLTQLAGLERRTARGGRDSIDHAPGGHDDVCNAAAIVLVGSGTGEGVNMLRYAAEKVAEWRRAEHTSVTVTHSRCRHDDRWTGAPNADGVCPACSCALTLEDAQPTATQREERDNPWLDALPHRSW